MTAITLLTKENCHLCDHAKEVLGRVAADYPITVETVDVASREGSRTALEAGFLFPPGVLIGGRPFGQGRLSEGKLRRELDRLKDVLAPGGGVMKPGSLNSRRASPATVAPVGERQRWRPSSTRVAAPRLPADLEPAPLDRRVATVGRALLLSLVVLLSASALMLVSARPAEAHATVVASRPLAGEQLASSPGIVTIVFSEALATALSHASLSSPDGRHFDAIVPSATEMQIPVPTNAIGVYQVAWTTVSSIDGHVLHGSFQFEVGVAQLASGPGAQDQSSPQSVDLAVAALRAMEYIAVLMAVGMIAVQELAARRVPLAWVRIRLWVPVAVALIAGTAAVTGDAANATGSVSLSSFFDYLGNGLPGSARMLHLGAEVVALLLALAVVRPRYVLVPLAVALVALAASGHAAAAQPRALTVGVDCVHLLAAGVWAGGILALATLRPPGGWRGEQGRALLRRFARLALPAFALTAVMGVLRATEELSGVGDLLSSAYGRILDIKVLAIGAMVGLSVVAWRLLRVSPRVEGAIAVVAIAATALLSSFPLPPARAAQADASGAVGTNAALPTPSDLTLGEGWRHFGGSDDSPGAARPEHPVGVAGRCRLQLRAHRVGHCASAARGPDRLRRRLPDRSDSAARWRDDHAPDRERARWWERGVPSSATAGAVWRSSLRRRQPPHARAAQPTHR